MSTNQIIKKELDRYIINKENKIQRKRKQSENPNISGWLPNKKKQIIKKELDRYIINKENKIQRKRKQSENPNISGWLPNKKQQIIYNIITV